MTFRPTKPIRVDAGVLESIEKGFLALRDEYVQIDLIREAAVTAAASANRIRSDLAQSEQRVKQALEAVARGLAAIRQQAESGRRPEGDADG